jgi:hypothetical protein
MMERSEHSANLFARLRRLGAAAAHRSNLCFANRLDALQKLTVAEPRDMLDLPSR